ncbi:GntR family transcriptional regulator [uncultured Caulobacter sp.]|uniref:GntR family transcriptional regulator n=1 Tax=uncultured Caulobacter sp. TaxID=158749 RepID=UPI00262FD905|nr:GntR family transcriptional regulator [uncultured Caulobacter sp.]
MGRDRDPFERTIDALRQRLVAAGPLQGAPLLINLLAADLGVSQTPVREALAWLAGESLIGRTRSGYVGATHEAEDLAQSYELALLLVLAAFRRRPTGVVPAGANDAGAVLAGVIGHGGNRAFSRAFARVQTELAPLALDEAAVCGDPAEEGARLVSALSEGGPPFIRAVRRHFQRRIERSADILAHGLLRRSRI